ncbi:MAG TPA: glutamate synthase large subunit [Gemmatimonadaceae bacterium]|nr:glutamate synthase large subunit [Gemmatimonadaceae bacterium]
MTEKQGLYDPAYEHDACGIGFVAHVHGVPSRDVVDKSLTLLVNLSHRSAVAADACTGDGAGILLQIPHLFFRRVAAPAIPIPDRGSYGVGMVFLPSSRGDRATCEKMIEAAVAAEGCTVLGWRDVPVDDSVLSTATRRGRPVIRQIFVGRLGVEREVDSDWALELTLYVIRRRIEAALRSMQRGNDCYVASLSSRTIVYKGMLTPAQLTGFYRDLAEPDVASAIALVHSRFSTNTFPSWRLAHPYRFLCHNGEINTLRGNLNWMRVREGVMRSSRFGKRLDGLLPVCGENQSDSASIDNVLELLTLAGRPLAHSMAMLIPEAWEGHSAMSPERRAFYEYHSSLMEPWDGPAAMAFTDGRQVAAVLDRNGLRPARYVVTADDLVVLASEAGALPIPASQIRAKGRLEPGRMLVVNTTQGRILDDEQVKTELASVRPYRRWVAEERVELEALVREAGSGTGDAMGSPSAAASGFPLPASPLPLPASRFPLPASRLPLPTLQRAFGYTADELKMVLTPMAVAGEEPAGSMGNDTPLAVLSRRPQLLFSYFRQMFAQVTNPAIDPIREQLVMSLAMNLGPQANLLEETAEHARQIRIAQPVLTEESIEALRSVTELELRATTVPTVFPVADGAQGLEAAMRDLCAAASRAVHNGAGILILSDRSVDADNAPIPAALAVAAVHHHLIRKGIRWRVSLVSETGEAREVSHVALLIAYGASAVHPYLALETASYLAASQSCELPGVPPTAASRPSGKSPEPPAGPPPASRRSSSFAVNESQAHYIKAVGKGLLKIMSKMGISTLQSYCGAQLWEAVGLSKALVDRHFTGTPSRVGGIGMDLIAEETLRRHRAAFDDATTRLDVGGEYQYRAQGEHHNWNPMTIAKLQHATRGENYSTFKEFSQLANDETRRQSTLRGLLDFVERDPVPLEEVESATEITRRFCTGAMSFGSLSAEAHETLAIAMNRIGGRSNSGEGGEDRARFGTDRNSAIKQVASARFGVTAEYLVNASELQIKIAQGAKPGEGGQLPGHKVDAIIARTRHSVPGVTLISPPPHHDIYSIEDLAQLIYDLKSIAPHAAVSVKLVAEAGVGTIAAGVAKARADLILISGDSGGTGASPLSSIMRAGSPWELGLAETQQTLVMNGLRGRVRLQTDGQLKTGRDVVVAALLGADEFGFATAPLIVQGCVMMRKCHLNTCPVGIATQDPELRARFAGQPEHVVNYFFFVAEEVREIMARLGFRTMDEMVGRTDILRAAPPIESAKAKTLDFSALLHLAMPATMALVDRVERHHVRRRRARRAQVGDMNAKLVELAAPALEGAKRVTATLDITNADRAVGATLSGEIARRYGDVGLTEESISIRFNGSAGQSFGAFAARGVSLELEGEANDYLGKGLSGGRLVVRHPRAAQFIPDQTVLIGNTALYGATSGEAFIAGTAGERFAVRNSGAIAVVEGVGDHGCEYMTGGTVVVLGRVGRNFGAGMSGGLAFVLDEFGELEQRANKALVDLVRVADFGERDLLRKLVEQHARLTGSARAKRELGHWDRALRNFLVVVPREYRQVLESEKRDAGSERREIGRGMRELRTSRHG